MKGILSLRGFRKLRTGAIVATGVFLFATSNVQVVQASEEDGVWEARTVEQVVKLRVYQWMLWHK